MMRYLPTAMAALLLCGTTLFTAARADTPTVDTPKLSGHWQSTQTEMQGPMFVTRDFHFTNNQWSVDYRAYADSARQQPLFHIDVGGYFVIGGPSPTVAGAFDGIFPATSRRITADSEAGVALFKSMGCTLESGKSKDLTIEGCGFLPSLMAAMGEYDLVAMKDGNLFFGDRSGDLNKTRPAKLYAYPLKQK